MNREIKFRVYHDKEKKMYYPKQFRLKYNRDSKLYMFIGEKGQVLGTKFVHVMQYTGLKDKNGKEIYEGDIVKDGNDHWEDGNTKLHQKTGWVKYMDDIGDAQFHAVNGEHTGVEVKNDCYEGYFNLSSSVEVIGNIYENPGLMKNLEERSVA